MTFNDRISPVVLHSPPLPIGLQGLLVSVCRETYARLIFISVIDRERLHLYISDTLLRSFNPSLHGLLLHTICTTTSPSILGRRPNTIRDNPSGCPTFGGISSVAQFIPDTAPYRTTVYSAWLPLIH